MPKKDRELVRDVLVDVREIEALSLECRECAARFEVGWGGKLATGAACPSCGADLGNWRELTAFFHAFMRASTTPEEVRLRLRPRTRLPL